MTSHQVLPLTRFEHSDSFGRSRFAFVTLYQWPSHVENALARVITAVINSGCKLDNTTVNWYTSSTLSTTHHHNHYLLKASTCSMAPDTTVLKSISGCRPMFIEWLATSFSVNGHPDQHDQLLTTVKDTYSMSCAIKAKKLLWYL